MEHKAGKDVKEQSHTNMTTKTEVEETALSAVYVDIEIDFNHLKRETGLLRIEKKESALLVNEETPEDSEQGIDKQQDVSATSTPAYKTRVAADCIDQGELPYIKEELEDIDLDIGPIVLQHMDSHYELNQMELNGMMQENSILNLDPEEVLSRIDGIPEVFSEVKNETIKSSCKVRALRKKRKHLKDHFVREKKKKKQTLKNSSSVQRKCKSPLLNLSQFRSIVRTSKLTSSNILPPHSSHENTADSKIPHNSNSRSSKEEKNRSLTHFHELLLKSIQRNKPEANPNLNFLLSILPEVQSMDERQTFEFKLEVMNLIKEIKYSDSNYDGKPAGTSTNTCPKQQHKKYNNQSSYDVSYQREYATHSSTSETSKRSRHHTSFSSEETNSRS